MLVTCRLAKEQNSFMPFTITIQFCDVILKFIKAIMLSSLYYSIVTLDPQ
jgi:hypothetical protein